jgi:hypothetical protein
MQGSASRVADSHARPSSPSGMDEGVEESRAAKQPPPQLTVCTLRPEVGVVRGERHWGAGCAAVCLDQESLHLDIFVDMA